MAKKLNRNIAALYLAYRRGDVPWYAKAAAVLAVGYALSPIDLIPDFIPILGYLDDLVILPALVWMALKWIPGEIMAECREQASGMWKDEKPKSPYSQALSSGVPRNDMVASPVCELLKVQANKPSGFTLEYSGGFDCQLGLFIVTDSLLSGVVMFSITSI